MLSLKKNMVTNYFKNLSNILWSKTSNGFASHLGKKSKIVSCPMRAGSWLHQPQWGQFLIQQFCSHSSSQAASVSGHLHLLSLSSPECWSLGSSISLQRGLPINPRSLICLVFLHWIHHLIYYYTIIF